MRVQCKGGRRADDSRERCRSNRDDEAVDQRALPVGRADDLAIPVQREANRGNSSVVVVVNDIGTMISVGKSRNKAVRLTMSQKSARLRRSMSHPALRAATRLERSTRGAKQPEGNGC